MKAPAMSTGEQQPIRANSKSANLPVTRNRRLQCSSISRPRIADWFELAVECAAFLVWRLSESGARIRFMTQRWSPENVSDIRYSEIFGYGGAFSGLKPASPHEHTLQIALSSRPGELAEAGWTSARIVVPDMLHVGADTIAAGRSESGDGADSITIAEKIEMEAPALDVGSGPDRNSRAARSEPR